MFKYFIILQTHDFVNHGSNLRLRKRSRAYTLITKEMSIHLILKIFKKKIVRYNQSA